MDKNNLVELEANLEALLFTYGEPVAIEKIAKLLLVEPETIMVALANLENTLSQNSRGLAIIKTEDRVQLVTKSHLNSISQKIIEAECKEDLTPAAIETLAVLAYGGPLLRSEIDYIRGVNSSYILRNLLLRGLIEKDHSAEGKKYRPSFNCLKQLGLASLDKLPDYQQYQDLIKRFKEGHEG